MKRVLYLGLRPPKNVEGGEVVHYPVIKIIPVPQPSVLPQYSHVIFTSQSTVTLVIKSEPSLDGKFVISVGRATTKLLESYGVRVSETANPEQAEGVIDLLEELDLTGACVYWPHSSRSRPLIAEYLERMGVQYDAPIVYETHLCRPREDVYVDDFDEVVFTSPSTVDGFLELFGELTSAKKIRCIGAVTNGYLQNASL